MTNDRANETIEFGEPRRFPLKWRAADVRGLNIPRCLLCGSRLRDTATNVCETCLRVQAVDTDVQGE